MDFAGRHVVVTGGASGIGAALARAFAGQGAAVTILDLAPGSGGAIPCDVSDPAALDAAIRVAEARNGPVEIYVSNAGVLSDQPDHAASAPDADWARCWQVNVMAHVHAARLLLPAMIGRRSGHFVIVASAAGLLNQIGDAAYSATKHAAVSFAESLAINHGADGIRVTLVCPQYVATPLIGLSDAEAPGHASLLTAEAVAQHVLEAMRAGRFLVLPHPEVAGHARARAGDHDEWIRGMVRLRGRALDRFGAAGPRELYRLLR